MHGSLTFKKGMGEGLHQNLLEIQIDAARNSRIYIEKSCEVYLFSKYLRCVKSVFLLWISSYPIIPLHISSLQYNPYCHMDWPLVSLR